MGWIDFVRLIRMLFGNKDPDLDEIQKMGLLAVKIGQVFALRIDLLGAEKCRKLTGLYSRQNELPPQQFEALIAHNGGDALLSKFAEFDRSPFAGGCPSAHKRSGGLVIAGRPAWRRATPTPERAAARLRP